MISSFTIPHTALSFNTSSVNLEGGPSYVHLDDYIEWNPPGVIPQVFPLMFGHTVTLTYLRPLGKSGGPGEHPQDGYEAWPGSQAALEWAGLALAVFPRDGATGSHYRESLLVSASPQCTNRFGYLF